MIITRTPYRVSFAGGGSDLPVYYQQNQGRVISCAIDKHIYISLHLCFDSSQTLIRYSKVEKVTSLIDIEHDIIRQVLMKYNLSGIELTCTGDIPSKTGLGSSSSFTVGLLNAVHTYLGASKTRLELAAEASALEIELSNGIIGKQDQYAAALGGLNELIFNTNGSVEVNKLSMSDNNDLLIQNLTLFYTGLTRNAGAILTEHSNDIKTNSESHEKQTQLVAMVSEVKHTIEKGNVKEFGRLLDSAWKLKRGISKGISTKHIDDLYADMVKLGCYGGKLLGAGGGGFILAVCTQSVRDEISKQLGLKAILVGIDPDGTCVIYDDGERK